MRGAWVAVVLVAVGLVAAVLWAATPVGPLPTQERAVGPTTLSARSLSSSPQSLTKGASREPSVSSAGAAVAEWTSSNSSEAGVAGGEAAAPESGSGTVVVPSRKSLPLEVPSTPRLEGMSVYQAPALQPPSSGTFAPVVPGSSLPGQGVVIGRPEVEALIAQYFPRDQVEAASRVSLCESGQRNVTSRPNLDGTRDHGIFQINDGGTFQELARRLGDDPSNVALALDAQWNVRAAAALYEARGWQPWTCARKLGLA